MRLRKLLSISLVLALGGMGANRAMAQSNSELAANMGTVVRDNTSFAVDAYRQLRSREGNLFFSPYSISAALALTYGGARGETEKQMGKALHFSLDQAGLHAGFGALQRQLNTMQRENGLKLFVANSLWPQQGYPFLDTYLSLAKERYGVSVTPVDYERATETARRQINVWVEEKTEQKIKDLIPPNILNAVTKLVLVNAIYFKGLWGHEFDPEQTKDGPFFVSPKQTITVPMMTQTTRAEYAESETLQILSLSYRNGLSSLLVLLPKKTDGLPQLEDDLSAEKLKSWREQARSRPVEIFLPRFKFTQQFLLKDMLQALGMTDAFNYPAANFSGMADTRGLFISAVIHKALVDVNEKGTEAAAATAVLMMAGGGPPVDPPGPPPVFRADHPFLFLIQDNPTGTILFLGRLTDPTQAGQ